MRDQIRQYVRSPFPKSIGHSVMLLCTFLFFASAQHVFAVSCHCFRDRSFNPSLPASADPYILATVRNSLLAAASGVDKGAVVRQRMTGSTETDLWLSLYLAKQTGRPVEEIQNARDQTQSWTAALDAIDIDTSKLGSDFKTASGKNDPEGMARALADPVIGNTFNAGESTLKRLGEDGANIAETTLSLYLGELMNRTPESVWNEVRSGERSWGFLLNSQGVIIETTGDLIAELVRKKYQMMENEK